MFKHDEWSFGRFRWVLSSIYHPFCTVEHFHFSSTCQDTKKTATSVSGKVERRGWSEKGGSISADLFKFDCENLPATRREGSI